jgi:hypothetical protein
MSGIIETRILKISNKIIKSHDIRRLFDDLETEFNRLDTITDEQIIQRLNSQEFKEYSEEQKEKQKSFLKLPIIRNFVIKAKDGSIYESESNEILKSGSILDTKQISSLSFNFNDYNHNASLSMNLRHTNFNDYNDITVKGTDSLWVNGIIQKIENFLESLENQSIWSKKYNILLIIFFDICIAFVFAEVLLKFIIFMNSLQPVNPNSEKATIQFIFIMSFIPMLGVAFYPARLLQDKLNELWPNIELQMGMDYNQLERKRRNKVWLLFTLVILPTALTLLAYLMGM